MKPLLDYFSAARIELTKVSWPNRRQTLRLTIVVIIFSIVVAVILGLMDMGFGWLLQNVIIKG